MWVFPTHLLSDLQRSLAERLRLLVFPPLPVEHGEVVEGGGHGRVVLPQRFLPDGQGVVQQVGRLLVLVLVPADPSGKIGSDLDLQQKLAAPRPPSPCTCRPEPGC